jgi:predicted alpha/beta hydrolase family esterase
MNCIIIHGSNAKDREKIKQGFPEQNKRNWIPWIKKELEDKGIKTYTPLMPKNWNPLYKEWKGEFEKLNVDEDTILIGHSAGGGFLVRWLGENQCKSNNKKCQNKKPSIFTSYNITHPQN